MNKKYTKRALFASVMALILCCAMLVGTTMAWFTDTASTAGSKIQAGNLDVDLQVWKDGAWKSVAEDKTPLFDYDNWEPGYTQYQFLKVVNKGSLALKWKAMLVAEANLSSLADVIDVYVQEGETVPANRADLENWTCVGTLTEFVNNIEATTIGNIAANETRDAYEAMGIAFKMQETAGNEYQGQNLGGSFDIHIVATQDTVETDSFDKMYDEGATLDGLKVEKEYSEESLSDPESAVKISPNAIVVINETNVPSGTLVKPYLNNAGQLAVSNIDVKAGSSEDYAVVNSGEVTFDNVDINSAGGGIAITSGGSAVFNSGSVDVNTANTSGRYNFYVVGEGSELTINDGTFSWDKTGNQKRAYIYAGEGATVYVNGGTFGKASTRSGYTAGILGSGAVVIKGGTFGFDPSAWVAPGYTAVSDGTNWTVQAQ